MSPKPGTHTGGNRKITEAERAEILRLARAGSSRNQIAREVQRSYWAVDQVCKANGISFDRSATKAAVAAHVVDIKARRAAQRLKYLDVVDEMLQRATDTYEVYAFVSGPDGGEFMSSTLNKAPAGDVRSLVQAATYASKIELDIDARDSDGGVGNVRDMLAQLGDALGLSTPGA